MSGLGLILGAAAAGGLQGGGDAARTSLASMQEFQQRQDLAAMQAQLELDKDKQIAAINHDYHTQDMTAEFAHQDTSQQNLFTHESSENAANRASTEKVAGMQTQAEIRAAQIHASAETAAAQIGANASMSNARLMSMARSVTTLGDGRIVATSFDPATNKQIVSPLMDPNDPTKPLMGMKNLDAAHNLLATSLLDKAKGLQSMGQFDQAAGVYQQIEGLLSGKLNINDIGNAATPTAAPPAPALAHLYGSPDPTTISFFDQKYGAGSAAKALAAKGISPAAAGAAPAAPVTVAPSPVAGASPEMPTTVAPQGTSATVQGTAPTVQATPPTTQTSATAGSALSQPTNWSNFNNGIVNAAM